MLIKPGAQGPVTASDEVHARGHLRHRDESVRALYPHHPGKPARHGPALTKIGDAELCAREHRINPGEVAHAGTHDDDLVGRDDPRGHEVITHLLPRGQHEVRCRGHEFFGHGDAAHRRGREVALEQMAVDGVHERGSTATQ